MSVHSHRRVARIGAGVAAILVLAAAAFFISRAAGVFDRDCLLLATVVDGGKLTPGSPVLYRGLQAGRVTGIRPPTATSPGFRVRMAVERSAFIHISTDARVTVQPGREKDPATVVILPGLLAPDPDYPLDAKVLEEAGEDEESVRWVREVLNGLAELSRAKRSEAEVIELREEVERLRRRLAEMEAAVKK